MPGQCLRVVTGGGIDDLGRSLCPEPAALFGKPRLAACLRAAIDVSDHFPGAAACVGQRSQCWRCCSVRRSVCWGRNRTGVARREFGVAVFASLLARRIDVGGRGARIFAKLSATAAAGLPPLLPVEETGGTTSCSTSTDACNMGTSAGDRVAIVRGNTIKAGVSAGLWR